MKKRLSLFALLFSLIIPFNVFAEVEISAPSAVLIDAHTGLALYSKNADKQMYPASTTKIMTAILAIENGNMDDIITVSADAVNSISYDSSKANLAEGEQVSYKDLVYALIVASANDAANVIAEHLCGSIDEFVNLMNEKAQELGALNTHFVNTHGLHDENHYTTASDLAKIAKYAMTLPVFRDAVMQSSYTIAPTNKNENERVMVTTNLLLNRYSPYYYRYATGIKTGHTSDAGYCLVSSASNGNMDLICVVLGTEIKENEIMSFADTKTIYSWAYNTLSPQTVVKKGAVIGSAPLKNSYSDSAILEAESDIQAVLPEGKTVDELEMKILLNENIAAPIKAGDKLGWVDYCYNGTPVVGTGLIAVSSYKAIPLPFIMKPLFKIISWPGTYIIAFIILIYIYLRKQKKKRLERLRKQHAQQRAERQKRN
ncbi:MAG: D-alanyl-D-alanine carboxypeptidase [Clostridia bacterium]|nr:D-alanyl-D-alanine carboxypeptidase [Clostridia bacterium]